jgi:peptidoglycan/LPS O-acetylase OafA/YrhL
MMHQTQAVAAATLERPAAPSAAVQDAVAPPPGNPRFPLFDSLRALAALSILLVHAAGFAGVFQHAVYRGIVAHLHTVGIAIFFLLSGFLLYRPMLASRVVGAPRTRLRDYARRRFLRIAPAYWLAISVLAIYPGIAGVFSGNWWVYYGLLQDYPVYTLSGRCTADVLNCGIPTAWSLAVEVGFYAVLPFFALGMARVTARLRGARWLGAELAVLTGIGVVAAVIQSLKIHTDLHSYLVFSPLGYGWWFGLGMGLAAISVWVQQRGVAPPAVRWLSDHPEAPWTVAVLLYVIPSLFIFDRVPLLNGRTQVVGHYMLFGVVAALLLLPAIFGDQRGGVPRRILRHPLLAWLGLISYGIFLWHFPILYALSKGGVAGWWPSMAYPVLVLTTLAITLVCASLSYYLVEQPLMRRK